MRVHIGHAKAGDIISFQYNDSMYCAKKTIHKKICYLFLQGVLLEDPTLKSGRYEFRMKISSPEEVQGYEAVMQVEDGQMVERNPR